MLSLVFVDLERNELGDYFHDDLEPLNHGRSVKELTKNVNRAIADVRGHCDSEQEVLDTFGSQFFAVDDEGRFAGTIQVEMGPDRKVSAHAVPGRLKNSA
jgi:hypothetical protein